MKPRAANLCIHGEFLVSGVDAGDEGGDIGVGGGLQHALGLLHHRVHQSLVGLDVLKQGLQHNTNNSYRKEWEREKCFI